MEIEDQTSDKLSGVARGGGGGQVGADALGRTPEGRTTMFFYALLLKRDVKFFVLRPILTKLEENALPDCNTNLSKAEIAPPSSLSVFFFLSLNE